MSFSERVKRFADDAKIKMDELTPEIKSALSKAEVEARELARKAEPEVKNAVAWSSDQAKTLAVKAETEFKNLKAGSADSTDKDQV